MYRHLFFVSVLALLVLGGCASTTTVQIFPSPQSPICKNSISALVLWTPQWRPDQKEVAAREAAADEGLRAFFEKSGCFGSAFVRRLGSNSTQTIQRELAEARIRYERVILVAVRELGPTIKIGSSLALVEGGTEAVLDVSEYEQTVLQPRTFTVQWRSGGPGVLKGVATLSQDIEAALAAGLQPSRSVAGQDNRDD